MCSAFEVAVYCSFFTNKYDNAFATQLTCCRSSCLIVHSTSTLKCACTGLVHIYVLSHLGQQKVCACVTDAMQWSLNAVAAAAIATLLGVQQPSFVLHPALTCARLPAEYCLSAGTANQSACAACLLPP